MRKKTDIAEINIDSFHDVKLSKYQPVDKKPPVYTSAFPWFLNGENGVNHDNFTTYQDCFDDSVTNGSIIREVKTYIIANGLKCKNGNNVQARLSDEDLDSLILDFKKFGGCIASIIYNNEPTPRPLKIHSQSWTETGLGIVKDILGQHVDHFYRCYNWKEFYNYPPEKIEMFKGFYNGNPIEYLPIQLPTSARLFPVPDYIGAIPYCQTESVIADKTLQHYQNFPRTTWSVTVPVSGKMTEEAKKIKSKELKDKIIGETADSIVIQYANTLIGEQALSIENFTPSLPDEKQMEDTIECGDKIRAAHGVPTILLGSTSQASGFSSNADEIETAMTQLYLKVIKPYRSRFIAGMKPIFDMCENNGMPFDLYFEEFSVQNALTDKEKNDTTN